MDQALQKRLIEAIATTVIAHAEELTSLDQAIGDGDHGLNMMRGFKEVMADIDGLATKSLPDALKAIGTKLVMKVVGPVIRHILPHTRQGAPGVSNSGGCGTRV
jgi:dihydroxyacetone kinase-like protein